MHAEPCHPLHRGWREEGRPDGTGAQKLHLASAVPLTSPCELQHQIFREHPAPEQLFLIATSQHCCPCLYITTDRVPPPAGAAQAGCGCAEMGAGLCRATAPACPVPACCPCPASPLRHREKRGHQHDFPCRTLLSPPLAVPRAACHGADPWLPLATKDLDIHTALLTQCCPSLESTGRACGDAECWFGGGRGRGAVLAEVPRQQQS